MRQDSLKNQTSAAKSQKHTYDKGLKPTTFNVGDYVKKYLILQLKQKNQLN